MPVLSYVHELFNIDQCQASIHTLRWKDRPLQCPRRQSHDVDPWGTYHYRPGCKRYWCNGCKRTFKDLTNTLLHQSPPEGLHHVVERHELGLFTTEEMTHALTTCGLAVTYDATGVTGRGLYIGQHVG